MDFTFLALPLAAILTLEASSTEVGLLRAFDQLPYALIGLFAGVWADRTDRRWLMRSVLLGRAVVLATVVFLGTSGALRVEMLYVCALLLSTFATIFDACVGAHVPAIVARHQLVRANSWLEAARHSSRTVALAIGGVLIQLTSPIRVLALEVVTSGAAAVLVGRLPDSRGPSTTRSIRADLRDGLGHLFGQTVLRDLTLFLTGIAFLRGGVFVVYLQFLVHDAHLEPAAVGVVVASFAPGYFVGAVFASRITSRVGLRPTLGLSAALVSFGFLLSALTTEMPAFVAIFVALNVAGGAADAAYLISATTLRQRLTPPELQGRAAAGTRVFVLAAQAAGAIAGGLIGEMMGTRWGMVPGAAGQLLLALGLMLALRFRLQFLAQGSD